MIEFVHNFGIKFDVKNFICVIKNKIMISTKIWYMSVLLEISSYNATLNLNYILSFIRLFLNWKPTLIKNVT